MWQAGSIKWSGSSPTMGSTSNITSKVQTPYGQPLPYYGGVPSANAVAQMQQLRQQQMLRQLEALRQPFGHLGGAPDLPQQRAQQQKQNAPQNMAALGMQMLYPNQQQQSPLFGALGLNALIQRQRFGMPADDT